jgi:hypothetical protein
MEEKCAKMRRLRGSTEMQVVVSTKGERLGNARW